MAPYEADAQMAFLALGGKVDAVLTEDSDLLPYGCPLVRCPRVSLVLLFPSSFPSFILSRAAICDVSRACFALHCKFESHLPQSTMLIQVLFKMDKMGNCEEIRSKDLVSNRELSFVGFTPQMFVEVTMPSLLL